MKRERTFQRRAKRLTQKEVGKYKVQGEKLVKGVWYFPFSKEADELIEEAKDCGLKIGKNVLLFRVDKVLFAQEELIEKQMKAEKEVNEAYKYLMDSNGGRIWGKQVREGR
jgi:hypothetical protein